MQSKVPFVQIGSENGFHAPLGMGCSFYGINQWDGEEVERILASMELALESNVTHFDTAEGYGNGESERLIRRFIAADSSRRERMFIASKANLQDFTAEAMLKSIDASRKRLQTDVIDLYYLHWAHKGKDLRPVMEGLETAKQTGKIRAIGVSNFSVEHMQQASEVTKIDAHQLGYSLLWRFPEKEIIPYCLENDIAVVVYSALAHGILAAKYERQLQFQAHDQRWSILHFRDDVWSNLYESLEQFKAIVQDSNHSPVELALGWLLQQKGVTAVLASAKNPDQLLANAAVLNCDIAPHILDALTGFSNDAMSHIPDEGNPFGYYP